MKLIRFLSHIKISKIPNNVAQKKQGVILIKILYRIYNVRKTLTNLVEVIYKYCPRSWPCHF